MYICIVFYGTFRSCACLQTRTVVLHTHTLWNKRKQIKEKAGTGERSQTLSVGYKKEEARLENYSQVSNHSNLVYIARSLIQCCSFPSYVELMQFVP